MQMLISLPKLVISFTIMEATFLGMSTSDALGHAGSAGAIVLAFLLRIALDSRQITVKAKDILIQAIVTVALCFLAIYVWRDFLGYKKGLEIYLFFASLFSVFIASEIEVVFKQGFRRYLRNFISGLMAKQPEEGGTDV